MADKIRYVRVDGKDYEHGSASHKRAIEDKVSRTADLLDKTALSGPRHRADGVMFTARELTYVSQETQEVLYDRLEAAEHVPIKSTVPRGAQNWLYKQVDMRGEADISAHLSTDDAPSADVGIEEFVHPLTWVTASYQYTIDELEASSFAGTPLDREKGIAAAVMIARGTDKILRVGVPGMGITGFFNNPNVPVVTLSNGEWTLPGTTPDEIVADLNQVEQAVITNSRDNHAADRILLPTAYEGVLMTTQRSSGTETTIGPWFLKNARMAKSINRWIALDDAVSPDVAVSDPPMGIFYPADPSVVHAEIPIPYEELPPEVRNFGWKINCRARVGGTVYRRPNACAYIENLD